MLECGCIVLYVNSIKGLVQYLLGESSGDYNGYPYWELSEGGPFVYYDDNSSTWYFSDVLGDPDVYTATLPTLGCPTGEWEVNPIFEVNYNSITSESCPEFGDLDIPDIYEPEEDCSPYEICRNKNLLSKSAMALSKDIASISKREVFGFKCKDAWENIFMRSLIIDALNCAPYGTYSEDEERCLIGKLTDKCNC